MKLRHHVLKITYLLTYVVVIANAYAGPEITGIPREPVDKAKLEKARLAVQLCGAGWTLPDNREHTLGNFVCVPVKPHIHCPPNSQLFETDGAIGCVSKPQ